MADLCPILPKTSTSYISRSASIFLKYCSIMGHNRYKIVVLVNFPKKILFSIKRRNWVQFGPKLFNVISHDLSQSFFKHFDMMGLDRLKKVVLAIFPLKSSFNTIVQFGPNMGQNYAT